MLKQTNKIEEFQFGLILKQTVNLDTKLNLDIGEETALNYKGDLSWKEFIQFHLKMLKKLKGL